MNSKQIENLKETAFEAGLKVAEGESCELFGTVNGYSVVVIMNGGSNSPVICFSVSKNGELPSFKEAKLAAKRTKALASCTVQGYRVNYMVRGALSAKKLRENLREGIEAAAEYLRENGYENCCQQCGERVETEQYFVGGNPELLCEKCFSSLSEEAGKKQQQDSRKHENVVGGIVGALLGSLVGAVVVVVLGQLGYVAAISGVIAAVCALKGYELLGGRLSIKGIAISVVLMLAMIYVGNRADWAISVAQAAEVDFFTAFRFIPELVREEYLDSQSYIANLAMVYIFALLGAVPTVISAVKNKNSAYITSKMAEMQ